MQETVSKAKRVRLIDIVQLGLYRYYMKSKSNTPGLSAFSSRGALYAAFMMFGISIYVYVDLVKGWIDLGLFDLSKTTFTVLAVLIFMSRSTS
jgi:hypothetical protein